MTGPNKYALALDELVDGVRVPLHKQMEEQGAAEPPKRDELAAHLPGNVHPYEA